MNKYLGLRWRHFHFLLLAVYSCLFFYNQNAGYFPKSSVWPALRAAVFSALVLGTLAILLCRRLELGALTAFLLTFLFLVFGHLIYFFGSLFPVFAESRITQVLMLVFGILLIARFCFFLHRRNPPLEPANLYLTVTFFILFSCQAFFFVKNHHRPAESAVPAAAALKPKDGRPRPNLYVIVLDAYARTDTLRAFFDCDNSAFLRELEQMGFAVGRTPVTGYFLSALSMASMFNMDYVQNLELAAPKSPFDLMPLNRKLDHSLTRKILGGLGYTFVATPVLFPPIECREADVYVKNNLSFDNLLSNFLDTTALRLISAEHGKYRSFVLKNLENIPRLAEGHAPAFVYTHLTLPHPPFVFTAEGEPTGDGRSVSFNDGADFFRNGQSKEVYAAGYRAQVEFLNRRIPGILRQLLRNDATDPYVILMSDHGPRMLYGDRSKSREELLLTSANLLAVRAPAGVAVPETALSSPINLMRFVNSQITGESFPPVPVHVYLSYGDGPYAFEEVTAKVQGLWEAK